MARTTIHGCTGAWRITLFSFALLAGCTQVKDKAHDLGSAFSGNYDTVVEATPAQTTEAAKAAVQDLDLVFISANTDTTEQPNPTTVIARNKQDERATITIVPEGANSSRITVSTGVFGNPTLRQQLIDHIRAHLKSTTQPTTLPTT
jgi:uncharacterized protein DUF3568